MNLSNVKGGERFYSDCKTTSKKRTDLSRVFTCSGKVRKGGKL